MCVFVCFLTALSLLYLSMCLLKVSNLKELRKDARREIGGKTTTLRNGTNIEQYRSNKAYDRGYRNGLADVDLLASNEEESKVQVENPTTPTDHPAVAAAKEPDMNNRVKKRVFERFVDSNTTPTSKLKYKKTLKVISNKIDSDHNLAMEFIHTAPEDMSSGARADHLMEYLD